MSDKSYDVPAMRKGIALIELLCESSKSLGISDISQRLDINKNMVFRLVHTLMDLGWITYDNNDNLKYRMTLQPFQLTSKPVSRMSLQSAAQVPLRQLWEASQTSCYLCILDKHRALCIEHYEAVGNLRVVASVGGHYYLHSTAPGKILLAYSRENLLGQLDASDMPALTSNTICDKKKLKEHLEEVSQQGYAVDNMENAEGVICYAVPIFDYDDKIVGTLGITSLTFHYSIETLIAEYGSLVDQAGIEVSKIMGASEKVLFKDTATEHPSHCSDVEGMS